MADRTWLNGALRWQSRAAAAFAIVLCAAAIAGLPLGLGLQYAVLLGGMALVGIPHGGFDHLVAQPVLRPRLGPRWWLPFLAGYIGLAGLVGVAWLLAPTWTLAAFLAASVLHFGLGDTEDADTEDPAGVPRLVAILALGGMPVLLPAILHPEQAAPVLAAMAQVPRVEMLDALDATWWLVLPWAALFAWTTLAAMRRRCPWVEPVAMAAAFVLLPPLLAFGVYFTAGHAMRHTLRLGAWHDPRHATAAARWLLRGMVPAALAAAAGMAWLGWAARDWDLQVLAPIFQAVAALTLPHMVVTLWLEPPAAAASPRPSPT